MGVVMTQFPYQLCAAATFSIVLGLAVTPAVACVQVNHFKPTCNIAPGALAEIKMRVQQYRNQSSLEQAAAPAPDLQKNCVTIDGDESCGLTPRQLRDLQNFVDHNKSKK
jgi:hypothetical protein